MPDFHFLTWHIQRQLPQLKYLLPQIRWKNYFAFLSQVKVSLQSFAIKKKNNKKQHLWQKLKDWVFFLMSLISIL